MHRLNWNLCTLFAGIGAAIAYAVLLGIFGYHWQLLPGAIAGLATAYVVSTALGAFVLRVQTGRYLIGSIIIGVGAALITLFVGTVAIAITNFVMEMVRELARAPSGQSFSNALAEFAPDNARDLIGKPIIIGALYGFVPAVLLGLVYGVLLRVRFNANTIEHQAARKWVVGAAGGTLLLFILLVVSVMQTFSGRFRTPVRPADLPMVIGACGEVSLSTGVLAYCSGYPCELGKCQWEIEQGAFALYIQPPPGSGWSWSGGGIGSSRRPDEIIHNTYWVQREPNGLLHESSPRRHVSYRLRIDGELIKIGDQRFQFEPGMLIVIQFAEDWSVKAGAAGQDLKLTKVTIDHLQSVLDHACASRENCETAFRIRREAGRSFDARK